jgi:hypothetical protein
VDLRFDLGQVIIPLWGFARTFDHLREAERLVAALDDQRRLGDVSAWWAVYLYWVGDPERALMAGHRALTIATALGDVVSEGRAMSLLGIVYYGGRAPLRAVPPVFQRRQSASPARRSSECVPPFTRGIMGHEIGLVLARELRLLVSGHPLPLSSPQRIQWHVCGRRRGQDGCDRADAV